MTIGVIVFILIVKYFILESMVSEVFTNDHIDLQYQLSAFGFEFTQPNTQGEMKIIPYQSIDFELWTLGINMMLLYYYNKQCYSATFQQPFGYVHHSLWLRFSTFLYCVFFCLLALDTFFIQSLSSLLVLVFLIIALLCQVNQYTYKAKVIRFGAVWVQRLYIIQLAMQALTSIQAISSWLKGHKMIFDGVYVLGFYFNDVDVLNYIHVCLMCTILGFGQLYETCQNNNLLYQSSKNDFMKPSLQGLTQNLIPNQGVTDRITQTKLNLTNQITSTSKLGGFHKIEMPGDRKKHLFKKIKSFDYKQFIEQNAPYVYLLMTQLICIVLSYAYYSKGGLILLSWVLLSFMVPTIPFVKYSIKIFIPIYIAIFLYIYSINIEGLYLFIGELKTGSKIYEHYGIKFESAPLEIGLIFINLIFLILLIPSKYILTIQRDEFKMNLFKFIADKHSNVIWQLLFYFLKRLHIFILFTIFFFGMEEVNVYFVGVMFFFIAFTASTSSYRKYANSLLYFASFFLWIQYFWSLERAEFDQNSLISKIFRILTFSQYKPSQDGVNQYLSYRIPYIQWLILFSYMIMIIVNKLFQNDKIIKKKDNKTGEEKIYYSTAQQYEEKIDNILRKKYPTTIKLISRIANIFSEFMIIIILLVQGLILLVQFPSILMWGFLILTFILQTQVISANNDNPDNYKRCIRYCKILKFYSALVIFLQVVFFFITDDNFLKEYGLDKALNNFLGEAISNNFQIIGFYNLKSANVTSTFISQIAFYITAAYLDDFFNENLKQTQKLAEEEQQQKENLFKRITHQIKPATTQLDRIEEEDSDDEVQKVEYRFERVRYSIQYLIYKKMNWWRFVDSIALNFHLVTSTVIVILCSNWQVSLFMYFYLLCTIILIIKAVKNLYKNGQNISELRTEIDINTAHDINKEYMHKAGKTLLQVRTTQWHYQYWALILSFICMYPTPLLRSISQQFPTYQIRIERDAFWLFWTGIYVSPDDLDSVVKSLPLSILFMFLLFEKLAQRWQVNRFGCTIQKIREFKILEEQKLVNKQNRQQPQVDIPSIYDQKFDTQFVTIGEAKHMCDKIQKQFRPPDKMEKLKQNIELGIKRKYTIQYRSAMKIIMEQLSLLLLLLSCGAKGNLISIIYLFVLYIFLTTKDKTKGMLIMTYTFGITLALEYACMLTNLSSLNSPMEYPIHFNPYPGIVDKDHGKFIFPWVMHVDFLNMNPNWTVFLGIDIERASINDIWFDFCNLVLLTIYFFNYGNPINAKGIKVSFSQTKSLEDDLDKYSRLKLKRKALDKRGEKIIIEEDSEVSDCYRDGVSDSQESYLGSTFYLEEIKNNIFIYYFYKKMKYITYIGAQIITIIMIFTIAILCRSLMSIGYMIACVILMLNITDFFRFEQLHQEGKSWKHAHIISGPLMLYSFFDIAIQIVCQIPLYQESLLLKFLGFEKLYTVNSNGKTLEQLFAEGKAFTVMKEEQLLYLTLKCFNMFFIFLQSRIFETDSFQRFLRTDLRKLISLAKNYKKLALTYRFNNWKIQKILAIQTNKKKMYEGVAELKVKMKVWQQMISGMSTQSFSDFFKNKEQKQVEEEQKQVEEESVQRKQEQQEQEQNESSSLTTPLLQEKEPKVTFGSSILNKLSIKAKATFSKIDEQIVQKMAKSILKTKRQELPLLARIYIYLKKKFINQIAFMTDLSELQKIKNDMEKGQRRMFCDLEKVMLRDIKAEIYLKGQENMHLLTTARKISRFQKMMETNIKIENMKRTQEAIQTKNIIIMLLGATVQALFCNLAFISYIFMILCQIYNAGFISLIFPFAVFGYALMEEQRPGKSFWNFVLKYAIFILFLKFAIQLEWWINAEGIVVFYDTYAVWILPGLWQVEGVSGLFSFILPEIIVITTIMGNMYYELLIGLYDKRETEIETIHQARERFINQQRITAQTKREKDLTEPQKKQLWQRLHENEDNDLNGDGLTYQERMQLYPYEIQLIRAQAMQGIKKDDFDVINENAKLNKMRDELNKEIVEKNNPKDQNYSMIDDTDILIATSANLRADSNKKSKEGIIKKYFASNAYFQRLFPLVKEQKPGVDLYAYITTVQFIICIYLLTYYTDMDSEGTQNLEQSSQFSFNMVMFLFFTIFVMLLERYINRTNTKKIIKDKKDVKVSDVNLIDDGYVNNQDGKRSMSIHIDPLQTRDSQIFKTQQDLAIQVQKDISLVQTKMTTQQIAKYFVQWSLLILYHLAIFWYFPLNSNFAIYGQPTCDETSLHQYSKYGCYDFKKNQTVATFYIIFCVYFTLSAYQIRYGLPDIKLGSSLTQKYDDLHFICYQIFYNIPFLMELKTMLDWSFTKTSLDSSQWLQLQNVYASMFFAACSNKNYFLRAIGTRIDKFEKWLCGCFCIGIMLLFLIGPFLFFSNLSMFSAQNPVTKAEISFDVMVKDLSTNDTYSTQIFIAEDPLSLEKLSEDQFVLQNYSVYPETKFFQYDQVQSIKIKNTSETEWALSLKQKIKIGELVERASAGDTNIFFSLNLIYQFKRPGPATALVTQGKSEMILDPSVPEALVIINQFKKAYELPCNKDKFATSDIYLDNFIPTKLRLTESSQVEPLEIFTQDDLVLTASCENYWSVNVNGAGIIFTTFSDLISTGFLGSTSIMAFYLGVAFLVGTNLRKMLVYDPSNAYICEVPNPGAMLNLIDCIHMMRLEQNLKKEEELYFLLTEVLRSPEMLKAITGTSIRQNNLENNKLTE